MNTAIYYYTGTGNSLHAMQLERLPKLPLLLRL